MPKRVGGRGGGRRIKHQHLKIISIGNIPTDAKKDGGVGGGPAT